MAVGAMFAGVADGGAGAGNTGPAEDTAGASGAAGVGRAAGGGGMVTRAVSLGSGCLGPKEGPGVSRPGRTPCGAGRAGTERLRLTSPGDGVAERLASGG